MIFWGVLSRELGGYWCTGNDEGGILRRIKINKVQCIPTTRILILNTCSLISVLK